MIDRIKKLFMDEEGATMVEYALMVALIAVALIVAIVGLRDKVGETFDEAASQMPGTAPTPPP